MPVAPAVHSVHIYDEHSSLISRLCGITSSTLRVGDSVLVVARADTRNKLVKELRNSGVDVRLHARERRFTMVDASEALATFMVNESPDPGRFNASIGRMLADSRKRARSAEKCLTVYGEMVAVLWEEGNQAGALQLEDLWNLALTDGSFHLHCSYPRSLLCRDGDFPAVCAAHSHILQDRSIAPAAIRPAA